jgi:inorganic triphosphatase YgiF
MRDDKGRFAEGNTGRKAGTPNKATTEIKEAFQMLLEDNLPTLQRDISSLEPKERVKFMLDLATFIIPKMKSVQVNDTSEETIEINFNEVLQWSSSDVIDFEEN